jgi:hypothetical protein
MVEQQEFQIPQQLRELAEKNVEQARVAYGQFLDGMAEAVRAWSTVPTAVMTSGFKVVQERAIQFAKENAEAGFALASELAKAKDLQGEQVHSGRYQWLLMARNGRFTRGRAGRNKPLNCRGLAIHQSSPSLA